MSSTSRIPRTEEPDFTPTPRDVGAMAEVLEGKHGVFAAAIADFFAVYRKVMSEYTEAEQRKVFHDNAVMFYRL